MDRIRERIRNVPTVVFSIFILFFLWTVFAPGFFSGGNVVSILVQMAPLLLLGVAETMVILTGGIDLSVGYVMGFSGVLSALCMQSGLSPFAAVGLSILLSALIGFFTGFLIAQMKFPPFIASLGTGTFAYGIVLILTKGLSVPALNKQFRVINDGRLFSLPNPIIIAVIFFLLCWFLMYRTRFGRNVISLGGNEEALRLTGVSTVSARIKVYVLSAVLCSIAGILVASRIASGYAAVGLMWDFDAIAATIIGGTAFEEGKGSILRTILGVLFLSILRNGLNIAGVPNTYQFTLVGLALLFSIIIDVQKTKRELVL